MQLVPVGVDLADDINESFATREIDSSPSGVVEKIVGVARNGEVRDRLAGIRVEHNETGGFAAADKSR